MKLTLMPLQDGNVLRIRCQGPITLRNARNSDDQLAEIVGPHSLARAVLLDLGDAQSIDTSGVVWLARMSDAFRQAQGKLVLHSVPAIVRRTLDVLRLTSSLTIVHDE